MEGLKSCVARPEDHCYACFDGHYSEWYGEPLDKLAMERPSGRVEGRR